MDNAVGSEVWIVPGFSGSSLIAIKVRLESITPDGEYWIDEPFCRPFSINELHTRQGAHIILRCRMLEHFAMVKAEEPEDYDVVRKMQRNLFNFRIYQLNLIRYMWEEKHLAGKHPTFTLTDKKRDKDWFSIESIDESEVDTLVNHSPTNDGWITNG